MGQAFILLNDVPQVAECIKHEVAHAPTPGHGHGEVWRAMARQLGCPPVRCAAQEGLVRPAGRYVTVCRNCGRVFHLFRRPLPGPDGWLASVNRVEAEAELAALRRSARRGVPYGQEAWRRQTAAALGLESSLREVGRPKKTKEVARNLT